mgnify:CR=1 FL=1
MANDFWILLAMVIYFAAMLSIGFIYSKRSNLSLIHISEPTRPY